MPRLTNPAAMTVMTRQRPRETATAASHGRGPDSSSAQPEGRRRGGRFRRLDDPEALPDTMHAIVEPSPAADDWALSQARRDEISTIGHGVQLGESIGPTKGPFSGPRTLCCYAREIWEPVSRRARYATVAGERHALRLRSLRPFSPTMTVDPSWPATPSGSGRCPNRTIATRVAITTAAKTRFAVTTRRA